MVEPTETETRETLDAFAEPSLTILREAREDPEIARDAPYTTPVRRLDEAAAAKHPVDPPGALGVAQDAPSRARLSSKKKKKKKKKMTLATPARESPSPNGAPSPKACEESAARAVRIFSGIQPTGSKHLGNYIGAIPQYVEGQDRGEAHLLHRRPARDHRAYDPAELRAADL